MRVLMPFAADDIRRCFCRPCLLLPRFDAPLPTTPDVAATTPPLFLRYLMMPFDYADVRCATPASACRAQCQQTARVRGGTMS